MTKLRKFSLSALALAALTACEAPSQPNFFGTNTPISTPQAMGFFQAVCLNNSRSLEGARQTLAGLPVIRNSNDDIYYHTGLFISFKVTPVSRSESVCSMVWDPIEPIGTSIASVQSLSPTAVLRDNEDGTITAFHYSNP